MKTAISMISMSILALSACAPALQQASSTLSATPVLDGGSYSTGGGFTLAGEIQNAQGRTALCGVWADGDNQSVLSLGKSSGVMATGTASIEGVPLHRGLNFMRKIDPDESYAGQQAYCVVTERAWQPGDEARDLRFSFPRQVVHVESGEFLGPGIQVVFRQTGPGA